MKQIKMGCFILLSSLLIVGCKKENVSINTKDILVNTILIKQDGQIQSGIVEEFSKDYYSQSELTSFIDKNIAKYNEKAGEASVELNQLEVKDQTASVVFTFADMVKYSEFNEVEAIYLTAEQALNDSIIPEILTDASSGESVSKVEVLKNNKLKVAVVSEALDVIVEGRIKYYSKAIMLNNKTVQSEGDGYAVVIFKP